MFQRTAEQDLVAKEAAKILKRLKKTMTWAAIAKACGVCKLSPQLWAKGRAPEAAAWRKLQRLAAKVTP